MKHVLIVATLTVLIVSAVSTHGQSLDTAPRWLGDGLSRAWVKFIRCIRSRPEMFAGTCRAG